MICWDRGRPARSEREARKPGRACVRISSNEPFDPVRQSLVLVTLGTVIGLGWALALTGVMSSLLYGITATDARAFLIPPLVLGAVALLASYLPARQAARVDPIITLRYE